MNMEELKQLRAAVDDAEMLLGAVGIRNSTGLSPEERIRLDIEYKRASDKLFAAECRYRDAVEKAAMEEVSF